MFGTIEQMLGALFGSVVGNPLYTGIIFLVLFISILLVVRLSIDALPVVIIPMALFVSQYIPWIKPFTYILLGFVLTYILIRIIR